MATKPARRSAGLLVFRRGEAGTVEVLLGHMGGPFWAKKDAGAWSIVKGEHGDDEEPIAAARREYEEETGHPAPDGPLIDLGEVRQSNGKRVRAWAVEGALDPTALVPGTFIMEWPPRSGKMVEFPELDRVEWMAPEMAREKVVKAQAALIEAFELALAVSRETDR